jgi:glycine oxidase
MLTSDVVICGGGVIGCSIAYDLAKRGASAIVVESRHPGEEASGAAAGMLNPQAESEEPSSFFRLLVESRELFPSLAAELEDATGIELSYRKTGCLRLAWGAAEFGRWGRVALWQRQGGFPVETLDAGELRRRAPGQLSTDLYGGYFFRDDAQIHPARFTQALWRAAEARGVRFLLGTRARALRLSGSRAMGLETDAGPIEAPATVNAAGAWADTLAPTVLTVPVRPARGQIVELSDVSLPSVSVSSDVYLVPHSEQRVWIGSTTEFVGFERRQTAGAVRTLVQEAIRLMPTLENATFRGAWSGFRPATPDALPILGETPVPGLFLATGHFRNGILLAPITSRVIAELVAEGTTRKDLSAFRWGRF